MRRGAPQATQVADRFHLGFNLRGAVEQELSRLRSCLTVPYTIQSLLRQPTTPSERVRTTVACTSG